MELDERQENTTLTEIRQDDNICIVDDNDKSEEDNNLDNRPNENICIVRHVLTSRCSGLNC